jgi:hypothetical protein
MKIVIVFLNTCKISNSKWRELFLKTKKLYAEHRAFLLDDFDLTLSLLIKLL